MVVEVEPDDELDDELDEVELLDCDELVEEVDAELPVADEVVVPPVLPEEVVEGVSDGVVIWACGGTTKRMSVSILRNTARTRRASLISSCPAIVMRR